MILVSWILCRNLIAQNTVDEKIMRALEKRAEVIQAILAEIKG
ncbi:MAG: hypothetical protein Q8P46_10375 [Hyphomicrobiales bacterium]|nr:hypothetical protein [Hyphomicrobiales bacterium]